MVKGCQNGIFSSSKVILGNKVEFDTVKLYYSVAWHTADGLISIITGGRTKENKNSVAV